MLKTPPAVSAPTQVHPLRKLLPPGGIVGPVLDTHRLRALETQLRSGDGRVTAREADALLRAAGQDGQLSAAELNYLQARGGRTAFASGFTNAAREAINRFTHHANKTPASKTPDAVETLAAMRHGFVADDQRIDSGEARALLEEAMSSGRSLSEAEVASLRAVRADPNATQAAKAKLDQVLSRLEPRFTIMPVPGTPHPPVYLRDTIATSRPAPSLQPLEERAARLAATRW